MQSQNEIISIILPTTFKDKIYSCNFFDNSCNMFKAVIHTECTSAEECDKWTSAMADSSMCTWRVRETYPNPLLGIVYRKDYIFDSRPV